MDTMSLQKTSEVIQRRSGCKDLPGLSALLLSALLEWCSREY